MAENDEVSEEQIRADHAAREKAEDLLREEWGHEYRGNLNAVEGLLERAPEGLREKLHDARFKDGSAVLNDPEAIRWLLNLETEINPAVKAVPPGGAADLKTLETRRDEILQVMRTDRKKYNADEKMQADLRALNAAIARQQGKLD